ncbi:MAG: hypothetical protein ABJB34_07830 [Acidobacteriota bacterium]
MFRLIILTIILFSSLGAFAQSESIDNKIVVDMSRSGLSAEIILKKIASSRSAFDVSAAGLIELKTAGVDDGVIAAMMDRSDNDSSQAGGGAAKDGTGASGIGTAMDNFSESGQPPPVTRQEAVTGAKTIAFGKSSLQPSRQALEKELMKRKDFQQLNITILRYKERADLFVDIGFVTGSLVTHRYVYRIYDRRSGAVITAGETTSWGSLAENLARHIAKSLVAARSGKMS